MSDADIIKMTEAQQKKAQEAFDSLDKKGEAHIKVGDIGAAMKKFGLNISASWMEKMTDYIDTEGTGFIGLEEFTLLARRKMQEDEDEKELKEMFRVLDKDKKGEVNVVELRWILKSLGDNLTEEDIDDMIADVDTDGSGWVDFDEFRKLMME